MKARYQHNARIFRQLQYASRKIDRHLSEDTWNRLTESKRAKLLSKIVGLCSRLDRFRLHTLLSKRTALAAIISGFISAGTLSQNFDTRVTNPFGLTNSAMGVVPAFADLDNDGDQDMLSGTDDGNFLYYENTGTPYSPAFTTPTVNPMGLLPVAQYSAPCFGDIDNDGDYDLISGNYNGDFIFFENTGTNSAPSFASPVTNPFSLAGANEYHSSPFFVDIDNDGDLDLFSGRLYLNSVVYYENTGTPGAPQYGPIQVNPFALSMPGPLLTPFSLFYYKPALGDIDGDGDMDFILGREECDFWYCENIGSNLSPSFNFGLINPFNLDLDYNTCYGSSPRIVDLDGNNIPDILSGSDEGDFYYFRNKTCGGADDTVFVAFDTLTAHNIPNYTYQWLECDHNDLNIIPGATGPMYIADHNGDYAVFMYDTINGCADTSDCFPVNGLSLDKILSGEVSVYPNPSKGIFSVDLGQYNGPANIRIYTIDGRLTVDETFKGKSYHVTGHPFETGIYLLVILIHNETYNLRLVVD